MYARARSSAGSRPTSRSLTLCAVGSSGAIPTPLKSVPSGNASRAADSRKLQLLGTSIMNFFPRFFQQRRKFKMLNFECAAQRLFNQFAIFRFGDSVPFHVADAENAEHGVIFARKNIRAQNVERDNRE